MSQPATNDLVPACIDAIAVLECPRCKTIKLKRTSDRERTCHGIGYEHHTPVQMTDDVLFLRLERIQQLLTGAGFTEAAALLIEAFGV